MHKKSLVVLIMLIVSIVSTACSSSNTSEETASNEVLPEFLKDKPEEVQSIYANAAQNKELLENIPYYCGCGESTGDKNNYDCFIHENKRDGKVVWDDHGTKCGVCLEIAAQSVPDLESGKSIKQIRQSIDEKYKSGYAKPTPTPEV
ncbi:PCYCGC motif-containing (lipo)protein [Priestia megaterium]|nr:MULTISPECIES: PCYCGC motif-containing (lipo)protein [Priestia]MDN3232958.1 PCYCGC motif-containing (lipo)protein [Priestia megaterium]WJX02366.1 PCYCGC motif-containing (lipo)protein [Priestia aryabhattai]